MFSGLIGRTKIELMKIVFSTERNFNLTKHIHYTVATEMPQTDISVCMRNIDNGKLVED